MKITDSVIYIGVNDKNIDLFEGQYVVPNGMAYNSYVIMDEKIAVLDTVDKNFTNEWLDNLQDTLGGKTPDYLIVQHMEPDHSANIENFLKLYPSATVVANAKTFTMIDNFFGAGICENKKVVVDGETLSLGSHTLMFIFAPMVHWPEVMVTYDAKDKILFSADGFGKFGTLDTDEDWACEARRYYFGIVGKYGAQVQSLLKKASALDIEKICPLHGPILTENLGYYLDLYNTWSSYGVESDGICIAYTSVYGNTKKAVELLAEKLKKNGCPKVVVNDLARCDMAEAVEDAFRYGKLVLATTTYNGEIFPFMKTFIDALVERNYQNRTIGFIENGTWAPVATKIMKGAFEKSKNITFLENGVTIKSALDSESKEQVEKVAKELCVGYTPKEEKSSALYNIGYGLYVVTCKDGEKDNGLILNTVTQVSESPAKITVNINKLNYSHHVIKKTGILNVNCLTEKTPFAVFEKFGFASGRYVDKFAGENKVYSENGLVKLAENVNAVLSLKVIDYIDMGSHGTFVCEIENSEVVGDEPSMTYAYYHKNVKPKPNAKAGKGYACKICGYVYEGEPLPEDFICPWCKHPASDFEPIK